ncbi:MAG: glucan biosynthesis protein G [Mailhella sp.]|nr:glucan biosynthesis protein G [Mailhella sp.]
MLHRLLVLICLLASLGCLPLSVSAAVPAFTFADVQAKAQDLARAPYVPPLPAPEFLTKLSPADWHAIRFRPEKALWAAEDLPFSVQFFHPGLYYDRPIRISVFNETSVEPVSFDPALFQYGSEGLARQTAEAKGLDFAGFRIHYPLNRPDYKDEVAIFLGASYFRALGKGNHYGIYSRGLALDTACSQGEEFPYFKEFWVEKPAPDAKKITVYALMDSPGLAGAYRFIITPGAPTVMDVKCALFFRKGARTYEKVGLAPLASMFFYGEEKNGRPGDFRPEVHNSDGLLFVEGKQWVWNPLDNPRRLSVTTFPLHTPQGFGLLQRDGDFKSYQDIASHYESRPSLWVKPESDWGPGTLNLVKIPTENEMHDNIVAFWSPDRAPAAQDGQTASAPQNPDMMMFGWKLFWMLPETALHDLGSATSTRISRSGDTMTFHVDFEGGILRSLAPDTGLASIVDLPEFVTPLSKRLIYNPATHGWRLEFTIRLPKEGGMIDSLMAARKGPLTLRFKAMLKQGENLPDPITETWLYDWQLQPK